MSTTILNTTITDTLVQTRCDTVYMITTVQRLSPSDVYINIVINFILITLLLFNDFHYRYRQSDNDRFMFGVTIISHHISLLIAIAACTTVGRPVAPLPHPQKKDSDCKTESHCARHDLVPGITSVDDTALV